ncbi:MAG TPA: aldose 1-epimerase [Allosphingosinicella sp.]|uniref:aldose 1-epimerase n=1 Tax=Allosphingosinicella sp. TaxID=2823234 RepID=UPI002EDA1A41
MDAGELLELKAGPLELTLSPTAGGSIARFDWVAGGRRTAILRGCNGAAKNILEAASFPLVPFVNRIRDGRFTFRGREVRLQPNLAGDISPLHGQGWLSPWRVEFQQEAEAALTFRHDAGEWPWTYEARQLFTLDERGLDLRLSCRNLSDEPMPCGLGQHPYFPCTAGARLDTRVSHAWTIDEHVLPVEKVPADGRFDLADRQVCGQDLDHGFGGWGGTARITDPSLPFEIILSSPTARFFQLYSPGEGGLFVAEPVTHANAAMNAPEEEWAELGFAVLEPGEEMTLDARIDVRQVWAS